VYFSPNVGAENIIISGNEVTGYQVLGSLAGTKRRTGFVIKNNTFYCKKIVDRPIGRALFYGFDNLIFRNNEFVDEDTGIAQSGTAHCAYFSDCNNVLIDGINAREDAPTPGGTTSLVINALQCTGMTIKNIHAVGYFGLTKCVSCENITIELSKPTAHIFNDCTNVSATPFVVETIFDLPTAPAPGMLAYVLSEKKFKKYVDEGIDNSGFMDV
jgi:hypothetical protein